MKRNYSFFLLCGTFAFFIFSFTANISTAQQDRATNLRTTVRDFGAAGDGKTDDTTAFQRAIDSGTGDIHIPKGTYQLTKTIVIDLDQIGPVSIIGSGTARIVMAGSGPALRLVGTHGGTAGPETVKENVWKNQRMPVVSGLEIVGANPQACGIEAKGTMQATFKGLLIRKVLHGIRIIGKSLPRPYADGELRGGNITITGNILSDVQVNVHLQKVRGVTIVGNTIWKGYSHDFLIEGSSSIVIGPNVFDRNPRYHYGDGASAKRGLVFRDCDNIILNGLQINNVWQKKGGIILERCQDFNISGCVILNCDNRGILMDDVQSTIVSGCTVRDSRGTQTESTTIEITKGKNNFIVNNLISGHLKIAPNSASVINNLKK